MHPQEKTKNYINRRKRQIIGSRYKPSQLLYLQGGEVLIIINTQKPIPPVHTAIGFLPRTQISFYNPDEHTAPHSPTGASISPGPGVSK